MKTKIKTKTLKGMPLSFHKGDREIMEGTMKEKIGWTAGKVWETLKMNGEMNISQLPKKMKEKSVVVQQALGWLAREDKINYHVKGNKILVSLSEDEKNIH
jgi:hypothetical protein